jgi:addiction module HigA family antidote
VSIKRLPNIHPGEVLREEFMRPLSLSSYRLAKELHVTQPRVNDIVLEKRGITADMALRLGTYFGTGPEFWMNLQQTFALEEAQRTAGASVLKVRPREDAKTLSKPTARMGRSGFSRDPSHRSSDSCTARKTDVRERFVLKGRASRL